MGKLSEKERPSLRQLRSLPGLRSMVELGKDGVVEARRGAPHMDLAEATPNFLRIGKMLGQSLGLEPLEQMRVVCGVEATTFAQSGERRVGVIHQNEPDRLLDLNHGT